MSNVDVGRLIFATEPDGSFGAAGSSWLTVDLPDVMRRLQAAGFITQSVSVDKLLEFTWRENDILFYTSAYNPQLRKYIQDVMYFVNRNVRISPSYDLLLAHENKGVQEFIRKFDSFGNLDGNYCIELEHSDDITTHVFKSVDGAGSSGVRLIRSVSDLNRIRRLFFSVGPIRSLKLVHRFFALPSREHFERYKYYYKKFFPHVRQRFVEGLTQDTKVLVFGDRYYTLTRLTRPGDFRASGSGRLDFVSPCPREILDFAQDIARRLDTPYLSLDVAMSQGKCHLIEFQALNFGPTTLTKSNGYYVEREGIWERVSAKPNLAAAFAHAIHWYVNKISKSQ